MASDADSGSGLEIGAAARSEPRWPVALAICVVVALAVVFDLVVPHRQTVWTVWLVPTLGGLCLLVLLAADPESSTRRATWLRRVAIVLVLTLAAAALYMTAVLSVELIAGDDITSSADELLASGTLIWLGNNVVFALLYWLFDSGGTRARAQRPRQYPDFAFPQHQNPELALPAGDRGSAITSISA